MKKKLLSPLFFLLTFALQGSLIFDVKADAPWGGSSNSGTCPRVPPTCFQQPFDPNQNQGGASGNGEGGGGTGGESGGSCSCDGGNCGSGGASGGEGNGDGGGSGGNSGSC